jgi:thymidylate synthase
MNNLEKNNLDEQYLIILKDLLDNGIESENRTGINTKSLFMKQIRVDLKEGFPIITRRHHSFKIAFYETLMFLNGATDSKLWLEDNGIDIWKGNTSREFLDSRGLEDLPVGDIGYAYGAVWRNFDGVDQLQKIFNQLKSDPTDRRMVLTAWHPARLNEAPLPPCHIMASFYVRNNKLSCQFFMRSLDFWNGFCYDMQCYALITYLFAKALNMEVGELVMSAADCHLYMNGLDSYNEFLTKDSFTLPTLNILKDINSLEDICNLKFEDLELNNYKSSGKIKRVPMAI